MIDLSNMGDAVFRYQNRFTVKMGRNENVGYKLELLLSAVGQLAPGDSRYDRLDGGQKSGFQPRLNGYSKVLQKIQQVHIITIDRSEKSL
jgi:hypothetical protein